MLAFYLATLDTQEQKNRFEYIYLKYKDFMYKTALSITHNNDLAEDAVQDTFLQILREVDALRIDNDAELKSYIYIITRERTIDFLRRWERKKGAQQNSNLDSFFEDSCEPEQIALTNVTLEAALQYIENIPEIYQRPLLLRIKGYSIREISYMTRCSEANVKVRIHRARKIILSFFNEK